jgi:hypothetical protein
MAKLLLSVGEILELIDSEVHSNVLLEQLLAKDGGLADFCNLVDAEVKRLGERSTLELHDVSLNTAPITTRFELAWEKTGVVRSFSGDATDEALVQSARSIQQSPRFAEVQYVIHDFRACTSLSVRTSTAVRMVARASFAVASKPKFCSAFVGKLPELRRMVDVFRAAQDFKKPFEMFETMEEARHYVAASTA